MRISYVDGPRLRRSLLVACDYAQQQRRELNRINVFPVPDGDTGTNLALTVQAIADHLRRDRRREFSLVVREIADASVLGARGNVGMMLSHFFLGFAEEVKEHARITTHDFTTALSAGVKNLYEAMDNPIEGTILTVMRETAEAARGASIRDFVPYLEHILDEAQASLARTPELLPPLKKAGVVDAGAKAFVHLLEGVSLYMRGDPVVALAEQPAYPVTEPAAAEIDFPAESETYRYCTEALVRGEDLPDEKVAREGLREMGDSLIVLSTGTMLKVHIHTDEPDRVFEYLKTYGTLAAHKAEDMRAQSHITARGAGGHLTIVRRPVGIVTDSAADLSEDVIRAHGIQVVPCVLVEGETIYRDGVDITADEFHRRLKDGGELPTTSQPPPGAFLEAYRRVAESSEEVLAVLLSSSLSGTFASAEAAASRLDTPITLVDSLGISLLQGLLVLKAAEMAELAVPPADIAAELARVRRQSSMLFTVDRFDRLLASGRVGRGQAWLGTVLGVKPILSIDLEGKIVPVGKVIGRRRVVPALIRAMTEQIPQGVSRIRFGIIHVARPEIVDQVSELIRARFGDVEILSSPATPVISTHLGIGGWGAGFIVED